MTKMQLPDDVTLSPAYPEGEAHRRDGMTSPTHMPPYLRLYLDQHLVMIDGNTPSGLVIHDDTHDR